MGEAVCQVGRCRSKKIVLVQYDPKLDVERVVCERHKMAAKAMTGWYVLSEVERWR